MLFGPVYMGYMFLKYTRKTPFGPDATKRRACYYHPITNRELILVLELPPSVAY